MQTFWTKPMLYQRGLNLFDGYCRLCPLAAHLIWKTPVYNFIIPDRVEDTGKRRYKEIWIDVTDSVPPFDSPKDTLSSVFDQVIDRLPKKSTILDFGAGKLRNTIYFLKKGYNVRAVEFQKTQLGSTQAKEMHEKAQSYGEQFDKLVFPHEFFESKLKFNLVLLVNVANIMPVPSERLLVIQYCRDKLKKDGILLWYNQHRDPDYVARCVPEYAIGDGFYMKKDKRYQTFYRDFEIYEIDGMFLANGFRLKDRIEAGHNRARLYGLSGNNPLKDIVTAEKIRKYVKGDESRSHEKVGVSILKESDKSSLNAPNPIELSNESFYIDSLSQLPTGRAYDTEYQNLVAAILIKLFMPPLKNPKLEYVGSGGTKRIDIVMSNTQEPGFFAGLSTRFNVPAPYIFIECKNYSSDISNPEIDQLAGRFTKQGGQFGMLVYRKASEELLLKRCQEKLKSDQYIVTLNDDDIIRMLKYRLDHEDLEEFMDEKMQRLLLS
jgi:SAM-dependent methyltransferase